MFVIVNSKGIIKEVVKNIPFVHEPHKTDFGFIAADRDSIRGKISMSVVLINKNNSRKKLLTGQFLTIRGIEKISNDRFFVTSVGNVFEMDLKGKIYHRMHLTVQEEGSERNLGSAYGRIPKDILTKGRCALKNLYKTAKTKIYD